MMGFYLRLYAYKSTNLTFFLALKQNLKWTTLIYLMLANGAKLLSEPVADSSTNTGRIAFACPLSFFEKFHSDGPKKKSQPKRALVLLIY